MPAIIVYGGQYGFENKSKVSRYMATKYGASVIFQSHSGEDPAELIQHLKDGRYVIVEGVHGYGASGHLPNMFPYLVSKTLTPEAFCKEVGIDMLAVEERIMCLRTYPVKWPEETGSLPQETSWETITESSDSYSAIREYYAETDKLLRVAFFDDNIVKRAISQTHPTKIVLNMLDYVDVKCSDGIITEKAYKFIVDIESKLNRRVDYIGMSSGMIIPRPIMAHVKY